MTVHKIHAPTYISLLVLPNSAKVHRKAFHHPNSCRILFQMIVVAHIVVFWNVVEVVLSKLNENATPRAKHR